MPPSIPFVVGQWVRGKRFYGRDQLVSEIVAGHRDSLWLLGTRRIGKTSLLREIERRAWAMKESRLFPLFWDFQGSQDAAEMHEEFLDTLVDAEARLEQVGITVGDVEGDDLFRCLGNLRRRLRSSNYRLLLLCDEAEALITLGESDPNLLSKLRRFMQSKEDVRSVLASTLRLWALARESGVTSPFLHGFAPPLYIGGLEDEQARHLIRQSQLPIGERPAIDAATVEEIRVRCDNHPYLLQLVSKRYLESGDLEQTLEQVASDPMVSHFFAVDFEMLSPAERGVIRILAQTVSAESRSIERGMDVDSMSLGGILHRLENLGYVHRRADRELEIVNYFFRRWFEQRPDLHHSLLLPDRPATISKPSDDAATDSLTMGFDRLDPERLEPGDKIGKFEILEKIGRGGFGSVYKGCDSLLQRQVAIKIGSVENGKVRQRFLREARIAANLRHPNIVTIHDFGFQGSIPFLVQEYLPGEDLSQILRQEPKPRQDRALDYLLQISRGMEYAHSQGVIHRDLKPANIRIVEHTVKIMDFGLAKDIAAEESLTDTAVTMGTLAYLPPEMIEHGQVDHRSDIFSFGVLCYEVLTGRRPFQGQTFAAVAYEIVNKQPVPLRRWAAECSPELELLVEKCLAKKQDQRISDFATLAGRFEALRGGGGSVEESARLSIENRLSIEDNLPRTRITPKRIPPVAMPGKLAAPGFGHWWRRLFRRRSSP